MTVFTRFAVICASVALLGTLASAPVLAADAGPPPSVVVPEETATAPGGAGSVQTPGCNPVVAEAQNRMADSWVAAERALSDDRIDQGVSVLQMTCFDQAAAVSGTTAANIFSGSIMGELQPIIGSALGSVFANFEDGINDIFGDAGGEIVNNAIGNFVNFGAINDQINNAVGGALGGMLGGGGGAAASYDCDMMQQVREASMNRGVSTVSAPTMQQMLKGEVPAGASEKFKKSWEASKSKNVFSNTKTAVDALPKAQIPSFKGTESLCDAIARSGENAEGCERAL